MERAVAAPETVGLGVKLVGRPNSALHGDRRAFRRGRLSKTQARGAPGDGWTRGRE